VIQLIMIVVAMAAIGGGVWAFAAHERDVAVAAEQAKVAAAQAEADRVTQGAIEQAANKVTDMEAAFEAGEAKGKTLGAQVKAKGAGYVAVNAAFRNVQCDIGPDLLRLVNDSTRAMRTAALADDGTATVPAAGATGGQQNANGNGSTAGRPQSRGAVGDVHPAPRPVDSTGQIPGPSLPSHPKPKPIGG
jgi:hypothetical protein